LTHPKLVELDKTLREGLSSNFQRSMQQYAHTIIENLARKASTIIGHQPYCHAIQGAKGKGLTLRRRGREGNRDATQTAIAAI
jgi:hypothetical protein